MTEQEMPYCFAGKDRLTEVYPGVFRIDLPMPQAIGQTNSYLFLADGKHDEGRSLLVDAGCNNALTKDAYDEAFAQLGISWGTVDVFITHFHWDHWAGLDQIWKPGMSVFAGVSSIVDHGAPVMAAQEIGEIERRTSVQFGVGDEYHPAYWHPMTINGQKDIPLTRVTEGDCFTVGSYSLSVLETPGHDLHHVCLYDEGNKLLVAGDQVLYTQNPPIMMESDEDQLDIMLKTLERLGSLKADKVLCGHGEEGSDLSVRCEKVIDHYHRQVASFKQVCLKNPDCFDVGVLSYLSTHEGKRTPWERRLIFGRRALLAQNMAYVKHLVSKGELPDRYEIVPLR